MNENATKITAGWKSSEWYGITGSVTVTLLLAARVGFKYTAGVGTLFPRWMRCSFCKEGHDK